MRRKKILQFYFNWPFRTFSEPKQIKEGNSISDVVARSIRAFDPQFMAAHKLERIEQPEWSPPFLRFLIERHGGTVHGPSRKQRDPLRKSRQPRKYDKSLHGFTTVLLQ